jgi:hypothetical protein
VLSGDRFADRRIFVTIAAYRDRDLRGTVSSALVAATRPERLRFGICHQFDDVTEHDLDEFADDPRFAIEQVPFRASRGVGWARARANQVFDDEPYLLQIDAHMRFVDGWDESLISMLAEVDSERALLSTYPPGFWLDDAGTEQFEVNRSARRLALVPDQAPGAFRQCPEFETQAHRPGSHALVAAGFLFSTGQFVREVPYDPEIYFEGEEIALAVRAYTHGFDSYWPNQNVMYHWYNHPSPVHWNGDIEFRSFERAGRERVARLLSGHDAGFGPFGLGHRRTLDAFGHFSGIDLPRSNRR